VKQTTNSRAAPLDMELPIQAEYGEDGKLHLHINADVVIHYHGDKAETVDGSVAEFVQGDSFVVTKGSHHTNPWGAEFYDQVIEKILSDENLREVMEAKLLMERDHKRQINRHIRKQELKQKLAKRNINHRRRKCCCG
jgi:hypothetical protein